MKATVEAEIKRILPLIPLEPPKNTIEILKKRGYLKEERLLYHVAYEQDVTSGNRTKMVRVHCTHCGGETLLEHVSNDSSCHWGGHTFGFIEPASRSAVTSGQSCLCPMCNTGMKAVHIGDFKSIYTLDTRMCMSLHNVEGHLAILSWVTRKHMRRDGTTFFSVDGYEGVVVIDKTLVRIKKYYKFMSSYSWLMKWEYTKRCADEFGAYAKAEIITAAKKTVESTDCAHSALHEYIKGGGMIEPIRYLKVWLKHPNVENLIRQGFSKYVTEVIEKSRQYTYTYAYQTFNVSNTDQYINWKEVKPTLMLGLTKEEAAMLRGETLDTIQFYKDIKRICKIRLTKEQITLSKKLGLYELRTLADMIIHGYPVPFIHVLNYLTKQRNSHNGNALITPHYLRDYWDSLHKVYGNLPSELLYPRDIIEAHDSMLERVKEKESAELNKKFAKRFEELRKFEFVDEELNLLIRPCATHAEIISEGKLLHHCVGGYANSHAENRTSIFFIRHIDSPETPFFTLEYNSGKVIQNRGDRNCVRTPEVVEFEKKWLEHIKKVKEKKEKCQTK